MLYFAYGSNMHVGQMADRCPGARAVGPATLPGYRLAYTFESRLWGGGVATVVPDDADEVHGVLWEVDEGHVAALDRYEGVAQGIYRREEIDVVAAGAPARALIYIANTEGWRRPSRRYVDALVAAALHHGLPDEYVRRLRAGRERPPVAKA